MNTFPGGASVMGRADLVGATPTRRGVFKQWRNDMGEEIKKAITITFTSPEGNHCEDSPAPGSRSACRMLGYQNDDPHCYAFDVRLVVFNPYFTPKSHECLEATKR